MRVILSYLPPALAAVFAIAGLVHLAGPRVMRDVFAAWGYTRGFHRVIAVYTLTTAAFLAVPETRLWGVALGSFTLVCATITLLDHRKYLYAVPNILLLAALPAVLVA
jgi:hypothetical protein